MIDYGNLLKNIEDKTEGLFSFSEIPEAVEEALPHRGTPYSDVGVEGNTPPAERFEFLPKPESTYQPRYSDEDLETRAELLTKLLMTKFHLYLGLGKGGLSELVVSPEDYDKLRQHQAEGGPETPEIKEILERCEIKKKLEETQPSDTAANERILKKAVKYDLQRKMNAGKLQELSIEKMMLMMVASEFSVLVGKNYGVFSVIGKNIIRKTKSFI